MNVEGLSRRQKALHLGFWPNLKQGQNKTTPRKRKCDLSEKNDTRSSICFEVKATLHKGLGTFATQDIKCGDILVQEYPIVSCLGIERQTRTNDEDTDRGRLCATCFTPIGTLRKHLVGDDRISIPLLDHDDGPQFTANSISFTCANGCGARWCSEKCKADNDIEHGLCSKSSNMPCMNAEQELLEKFIIGNEHSTELRLAAKCVLKLAAIITSEHFDVDKLGSNSKALWWKEYAHPLWWNNSSLKKSDKEDRKDICKTLSNLLHKILLKKYSSNDARIRLDDICTVQNIAEILGMLQCNVMEFEFPSPAGQYISHLDQILEDLHTLSACNDDDNSVSSTANGELRAMEEWIKAYEEGHRGRGPMVGSGLFPILTLANHDCDPNASIEFLEESNLGSLVALREIGFGEEITITYIPNGDFDCGDECGDRFKHFTPTRTWKCLNDLCDEDFSSDDEECNGDIVNIKKVDECENESNEETEVESGSDTILEGSDVKDRAMALLEYGFHCQCKRCAHENSHDSSEIPYVRR